MVISLYPTYMTNPQNNGLFWASQYPRQSLLFQLFSPLGAAYRFQTNTNPHGPSIADLLRSNRENRAAKLIWAPCGGLRSIVIGKEIFPLADLIRRDLRIPNSQSFEAPDGFQYRWRPSTNSQDIVMHPSFMDLVIVTALLYRFVLASGLRLALRSRTTLFINLKGLFIYILFFRDVVVCCVRRRVYSNYLGWDRHFVYPLLSV
jgi:hypothetical protein